MVRGYKYLLLIILLLLIASPAVASTAVDYQLPNGMKVILIENHRAPVASMMVWVKVGSASERPGGVWSGPFDGAYVVQGDGQTRPRRD